LRLIEILMSLLWIFAPFLLFSSNVLAMSPNLQVQCGQSLDRGGGQLCLGHRVDQPLPLACGQLVDGAQQWIQRTVDNVAGSLFGFVAKEAAPTTNLVMSNWRRRRR
jgi:hypothetical protein